jgi:hypothetical protein
MFQPNNKNGCGPIVLVAVCLVAALGAIAGLAFGLPQYHVYCERQGGRAVLAKSEFAKQALIQEAHSKQEAARFLAEAEVIRADGVAKANKIIGDSLQGNEAYLHYLWIHNLELGNNEVIYVATETGMPIFEAGGRFQRKRQREAQP